MDDFRLVIITGLSGAGKTQVSRNLEDLGYFCVDNLPPVFIPKFAELCAHSAGRVNRVALVVDMRSREFFDTFVHILDTMDSDELDYELVFMEASDETIIRRYKETRRRHPLAPASRVIDGITRERERLAAIRGRATYVIDTSNLKKTALTEKIVNWFGKDKSGDSMNITVLSFGFKYGMPLDADMVWDVRFMPNPFYIESLKYKSGTVTEVADYIEKWPVTKMFNTKLDDMLDFLIPYYIKEGKSQLVIAVGCTGGMHRSVYMAKRIYERLKKQNFEVNLEHRDLMKNDVREHSEQ